MGGGLGLVVRVDRDPRRSGVRVSKDVGVPGVAVRGRGFRGCCVIWLIGGLLGLAFLSGLVVFIRKRRARPTADDTLVADLLGPPELPEFAPRTWDDNRSSLALQAREDGPPRRAPRQPSRARRQPSPASQTPDDCRPPRAPGQPSPAPKAREDDPPASAPGQPSPAPQTRKDGPPARAPRQSWRARRQPSPAPQAREDGPPARAPRQPSPAPGRPTPAAGQPSPTPGRPSPAPPAGEDGPPSPAPSVPPAGGEDWLETQLAWINAWSQRMKEQIASTEQPEPHSKE
jgi:hypothetical protein